MSELSPRLALPFIQPSQAQKHVTHNEALRVLDTLVQMRIAAFDAITPPVEPVPGACFALGPAPTLAWAGQGGTVAVAADAGWQFLIPAEGWLAWDETEGQIRVYAGETWQAVTTGGGALPDQVPTLGVATTPDPVNRLAVASEATLFSHAGNGHQMKLNKAAATDTASLLFQSDWTGHAEMGLAGDTAFSIKTSADGATWFDVMRADPAAQSVTWSPAGSPGMTLDAAGLHLDVPLTGTAVQAEPADETPGRLLTTGAFGLGDVAALEPPADDLDAIRATGFYRADSVQDNKPQGNTGNWVILHQARTSNAATQVAISRSTGLHVGMVATRTMNGGTWSPWYTVYTSTTIVGDVTQDMGAPTGAILERGETADGAYIRYADGTQICWHSLDASAIADTEWSYPVAFVGAVSATLTPVSTDPVCGTVQDVSTISLRFNTWSLAAARVSRSCHLVVTGRWF